MLTHVKKDISAGKPNNDLRRCVDRQITVFSSDNEECIFRGSGEGFWGSRMDERKLAPSLLIVERRPHE